jgi:hypothetical protein
VHIPRQASQKITRSRQVALPLCPTRTPSLRMITYESWTPNWIRHSSTLSKVESLAIPNRRTNEIAKRPQNRNLRFWIKDPRSRIQDHGSGNTSRNAYSNENRRIATKIAVPLILENCCDSTFLRFDDIEVRRKVFKVLCLKWHPDKNTAGMGEAESTAQANEIFKHLMARRNRYLTEYQD